MTKSVAVVVGAGPGLGSALGRQFAKAGMRVVLARRNSGAVKALADDLGGKAYDCDVTDQGSVHALFENVVSDLGPPVLAVYNAGAYLPGSILDIDAEAFERCWRVGCLGGFHVGQTAARLMVEAGEGTIIFTGATASLRGGAGFANLAVPKFGLRALAQSMARELGPKGVHVAHVIIDGLIASDDRPGYSEEERGTDAVLKPDAIAENFYRIHAQAKSTWTQELDLRPWTEKF